MTVTVSTNSVTWLGNGATTVFSYSFAIPTAAEASLLFTTAAGVQTTVAASAYTITGVGQPTAGGAPQGGTVTYAPGGLPIAAGTLLTLIRTVPYTQPNALSNQGGLWPVVVEGSDDNLEMQIQQLAFGLSRALLFNVADTGPFATFPPAAQRALGLLGFDASGNPIVAQPSSALVSTAMQAIVAAASVNAASVDLLGRYAVTQTLTLYVNNVSGSDSTGTGTAAAPFLTIQHAVNVLCDTLIINNVPVVIQLMTTGVAYSEAVSLRSYVGSWLAGVNTPIIQGNASNVNAVTVAPAAGGCFTAVGVSTPWTIASLTMAPVAGHCLTADWGSILYHWNANFGATASAYCHISCTWSKVEALRGSIANGPTGSGAGPYLISGGAGAHINCNAGVVLSQGNAITVTGSPALVVVAAAYGGGYINYLQATVTGTTAGIVTSIDQLSTIIGPPNGWFGTTAGTFTAWDYGPTASINKVRAVGASSQAINSYDRFVALNVPLSAAVSWTLPLASTLAIGAEIVCADQGGISGSNTVTVTCASGDQFTDGTTTLVMATRGKCVRVAGAGAGFWFKLST